MEMTGHENNASGMTLMRVLNGDWNFRIFLDWENGILVTGLRMKAIQMGIGK
jgi:hypothetical protein